MCICVNCLFESFSYQIFVLFLLSFFKSSLLRILSLHLRYMSQIFSLNQHLSWLFMVLFVVQKVLNFMRSSSSIFYCIWMYILVKNCLHAFRLPVLPSSTCTSSLLYMDCRVWGMDLIIFFPNRYPFIFKNSIFALMIWDAAFILSCCMNFSIFLDFPPPPPPLVCFLIHVPGPYYFILKTYSVF